MKTNRMQLMSEGKISKSLFLLGIPMVVSMLVMALYNVVDTYFVSGLGSRAIAAVSVAFPISLVFSGIGLTFGAGAGSYISRSLGKQDKETANRAATTALYSSAIAGVVAAVLMIVFLTPVLQFMGAIPSVLDLAKQYATIFIISTVFSTVNITVGNLAVSQGAPHISLLSMICGAVLNMILDPIFITGFRMGVRGAAVATLISQLVTGAIYVWFFAGGKSDLKIAFSQFKPSFQIYKEILKVGVSMLLLQLLSGFSMSRISAASGNYGQEAIAAMGIVLRIVTLGTNVVFGYMKGFQPLAGFSYGAKNYSSMKWTTGFCVIWTAFLFLLSEPILSLFGSDPRVIAIAVPALRANTVMFFTFGFQFTYSTLYLSMGKALEGGFLNICRQGILFLPVIYMLPAMLGLTGVMYTQAIADGLTTIVTVFFAIGIHKKLKNMD